jgi:shikimate dehydrogenase
VRCAVLGSPIAHSLSPAMHRAAYDELGLDWSYEHVEVTTETLPGFLDGLGPEWRGLSLTMPLKRAVMPLADDHDEWCLRTGVANTLVLEADRRAAANTDVPGAGAALEERGLHHVPRAVVLGGGATATSVLLALTELGCTSARVLVRDPARAEETVAAVSAHPQAPRLDVGVLDAVDRIEADLVVSTIPAEAQQPGLLNALEQVPAVFEVVYDPWPTPLSEAARASGRVLVSGVDLLAQQAVLQVELMTGGRVSAATLREAALAELGRRAVHRSREDG